MYAVGVYDVDGVGTGTSACCMSISSSPDSSGSGSASAARRGGESPFEAAYRKHWSVERKSFAMVSK